MEGLDNPEERREVAWRTAFNLSCQLGRRHYDPNTQTPREDETLQGARG